MALELQPICNVFVIAAVVVREVTFTVTGTVALFFSMAVSIAVFVPAVDAVPAISNRVVAAAATEIMPPPKSWVAADALVNATSPEYMPVTEPPDPDGFTIWMPITCPDVVALITPPRIASKSMAPPAGSEYDMPVTTVAVTPVITCVAAAVAVSVYGRSLRQAPPDQNI